MDEANRALVLVRRIASDIVARYNELVELKHHRTELLQTPASAELVEYTGRQISDAIAALNRLHHELTDIGCVLKDWATGLVDFPALHEDRRVWLCWRVGEDAITHWHELHAGVSGRQEITDGFGTPLSSP